MTSARRWGDGHGSLSPKARTFLVQQLGGGAPADQGGPATTAADAELDGAALDELRAILGDQGLSVDLEDRRRCSAGMSYLDLLADRDTEAVPVVAAVATPCDHEQSLRLLQWCSQAGVEAVPVGGGTSVVGGLAGHGARPRIAVSTSRMGDIVALDEVSGIATVGPGITGPELERQLAERGWTLGHFPQSWERATVGGYAAARSAGQASTGYGRFEDLVEAATLATPAGTWQVGRGPASAAGPSLLHLALGSEGALGIFTRLELRVRRLPAVRRYEAAIAPDFASGAAAFRELAQAGLSATVMRLSDEDETAATMAMSGPQGAKGGLLRTYLRARGIDGGALVILGWEGSSGAVLRAQRRAAWRILRRHRVRSLGSGPGRAWVRNRFSGPHLRDSLMDEGFLVETFETAAPWQQVGPLHASLRAAAREALGRCYAMAHLSHIYETGASIYVTVLASATESGRPLTGRQQRERWLGAKARIMQTIADAGCTLSHHHGVGRDHAPWLEQEIGPLGLAVLQSVKSVLDPEGIMNPGVLVPVRGR